MDTRSRTLVVKVSPVDGEGHLHVGMLARVTMSLSERQNAILAPEPAVLKRGAETSVFVVAGGKAQFRRVELGASDGQNVEIKSGLAAGEADVLDNTTLKHGEAVVENRYARCPAPRTGRLGSGARTPGLEPGT